MVSLKEDSIDFKKLEQEFYNAVEADARYDRENSAKFRAVNQKVGSYEEFRDIVLASHIKPLEKKDRLDQIERFTQPWNIHGKKSSKEVNAENAGTKIPSKLPSNGHEFARNWRRDCKSDVDRYNYLITIGGDNLAQMFKSEISMGLLGDIISTLNCQFKEDDTGSIVSILNHLSTVNRFKLSVQFLSQGEKDLCSSLVEKLSKHCDESHDLSQIREKYELS